MQILESTVMGVALMLGVLLLLIIKLLLIVALMILPLYSFLIIAGGHNPKILAKTYLHILERKNKDLNINFINSSYYKEMMERAQTNSRKSTINFKSIKNLSINLKYLSLEEEFYSKLYGGDYLFDELLFLCMLKKFKNKDNFINFMSEIYENHEKINSFYSEVIKHPDSIYIIKNYIYKILIYRNKDFSNSFKDNFDGARKYFYDCDGGNFKFEENNMLYKNIINALNNITVNNNMPFDWSYELNAK